MALVYYPSINTIFGRRSLRDGLYNILQEKMNKGFNITLLELQRVLKPQKSLINRHDYAYWWFLPWCDCNGKSTMFETLCSGKCRINMVYITVYNNKAQLPNPVSDLNETYVRVRDYINTIDIDDVECPICMDNLPIMSVCSKSCKISVCQSCFEELDNCPQCRAISNKHLKYC